jgi:hypothetical protein
LADLLPHQGDRRHATIRGTLAGAGVPDDLSQVGELHLGAEGDTDGMR